MRGTETAQEELVEGSSRRRAAVLIEQTKDYLPLRELKRSKRL
jgi:hypothetical protein